MAKIDLDKFICSMIEECKKSLSFQGLEYKDGRIVECNSKPKESEDDNIVDDIITALINYCPISPRRTEMIAWLDKLNPVGELIVPRVYTASFALPPIDVDAMVEDFRDKPISGNSELALIYRQGILDAINELKKLQQ